MEAFAVSFGLVALAEIGDKTQLLALVLPTRFRRPWPLLAGIFVATLLNHLLASAVGLFVGIAFSGPWLKWVIAASFFAIAIWAFFPARADDEDRPPPRRRLRCHRDLFFSCRDGGSHPDRDGGARRPV